MYGTREDLCRMLNEQYPAETPLNLIIWTPADIEALADGMEYSFSEHDVRAVLERGNDSNLLIVFYVQIVPDDFVMQLHRF